MKTKSMILKSQALTANEMEAVCGGKNEQEKTYNGGTLQEIIVTPDKRLR